MHFQQSHTLSLYIARHFAVAFLLIALAIVGLIFIFDLLDALKRLSAYPQVYFMLVVKLVLLKLPQSFLQIIPFAVLASTMFVFWRLARSQELVVMRSVGVSVWQFLMPVLLSSFVFGLLSLFVLNPVASALYKQYEALHEDHHLTVIDPLSIDKKGFWLGESDDLTQYFIHAEQVQQERFQLQFSRVSVLIFDKAHKFIRRIEAEKGYLEEPYLKLENAWVLVPKQPTVFRGVMDFPTSLTFEKVQDNFASPETISFWELFSFIRFFEESGFSARRHRLHLHSLIVLPLILCAMVLVASVFSINPNQRQARQLFRVLASLTFGFLLFFLSRVTYAMGLQTLPIFLATWSVPIVSILLSATLLFHLEDG